MAEELTSGQTQEAPSENKEQVQPKAESPQSEQPQQEAQPKAPESAQEKPVNLYELPEFKKFQAQQNKTITQMQQRLAAAEQAAEQARTSGMDEQDRLKYEYEKLLQKSQQYEAEQAYQAQKQRDLVMLSEKFKVPVAKLWDAESYEEALERVATYQTEQVATKQATKAEKLERNTVDLGGGKPVTVEDERAKTLKATLASGNSKDYIKMLLEE